MAAVEKITGTRLSPLKLAAKPSQVLSLPASQDDFQPQPPPPPRGHTWLKVGAAGMAGLSALGALAYVGNAPALQQVGEIKLYPQILPIQQQPLASTPGGAATVAGAPRGDARLAIPGAQAREFLEQLSRQPRFARQLEQRLSQVQSELQQQLSRIDLGQGQVLLDVRAPLPTAQRSFLHWGEMDLPSLGYRALASEMLPAQASYQVDPVSTGLRVEVSRVQIENPPEGPGVLLGALQVEVRATRPELQINGRGQLRLDLDGQASARQLQALQGKPGQESLRQELHQRQQTGERLAQTLQQQNLRSQVEQAAQQDLEFEARLQVPEKLASSTLYLWAVPDRSGDGRADLQLTRSDHLEGLQQLRLELKQAQFNQGQSTAFLQRQVQSQLEKQLLARLGEIQEAIPQQVAQEVERAAGPGLRQAEREANRELARLYSQRISVGSLPVGLGQVAVRAGQIEVDLASPQAGRLDLSPPLGRTSLTIDLATTNRHLRQSVNWPQQLEAMRAKAKLRDLQFARNGEPQLSFRQGRLHLTTEVIAKTSTGLGPIFNGVFGSTVHTRLSVPLEVKVSNGRLVVAADRNAVEFQQAQGKTPFNLLDLMPTRIISNLLSQLALGTGMVKPGEMSTQLDLSQPFGVHFNRAQLDKKGNLIIDFHLDAQAARWLAQTKN